MRSVVIGLVAVDERVPLSGMSVVPLVVPAVPAVLLRFMLSVDVVPIVPAEPVLPVPMVVPSAARCVVEFGFAFMGWFAIWACGIAGWFWTVPIELVWAYAIVAAPTTETAATAATAAMNSLEDCIEGLL